MRYTRATVSTLLSCVGASALSSCGGSGYNGPAASVSFSSPAQASGIRLGQRLTLSWRSVDATSCTASTSNGMGGNFSGSQPTNGSLTVAPAATGSFTYTLSCAGSGGAATASTVTVTVGPSILSQLSRIAVIGSTVDAAAPTAAQGGNPYGLTIAPATSGPIAQGDLIVCNFNDSAGTEGAGTTLVGLHPSAGATPYNIAQSTSLQGCNAVAMLADDSIAAAAYSANTLPLVSSTGTLGSAFAAEPFAQPWGAAYVPATSAAPAALYVTNVGSGTGTASIDRIELNGDAAANFTEIAKGFCGSGKPGAIYAPAGLTYDPSIDTLYVVDTSSYSVLALSNVSKIGSDGVLVNGGCGGATPTPALQFSGPSAAFARVIASGGQFNAPISAALLMDGDLIVGNGDLDSPSTPNLAFEISASLGFVGKPLQLDGGMAGALFGIAATVDSAGNQIIYFNDDNTSKVNVLTQ
jgi:hypothetical protein